MLKASRFKLLDQVRLDSNTPIYQGDSLLLYENTQVSPATSDTYRLKMLALDHDIVVPRAALGIGSLAAGQ
jgi:urease accessory protein UreH